MDRLQMVGNCFIAHPRPCGYKKTFGTYRAIAESLRRFTARKPPYPSPLQYCAPRNGRFGKKYR